MWAVHGSLLIKMFSLTVSIPQAVASTLGLGLSSDASAMSALYFGGQPIPTKDWK